MWHFIQPLFTTVIFTIIFGKIAKISTDGAPPFLFYMAGTVIWTYFSNVLTSTSSTFTGNAGIFGKVYFPRLAVPVAHLFSRLIAFVIQFIFFLCFLAISSGGFRYPAKHLGAGNTFAIINDGRPWFWAGNYCLSNDNPISRSNRPGRIRCDLINVRQPHNLSIIHTTGEMAVLGGFKPNRTNSRAISLRLPGDRINQPYNARYQLPGDQRNTIYWHNHVQ